MSMIFRQLIDSDSSTLTYLLGDPWSREAVIIDPVVDNLERDLAVIGELGLTLRMAIESHVHADHVTAGHALRQKTGCQVAVARAAGALGADRFLEDGDAVRFGLQALEVRATPGHTLGCLSYVNATSPMVFTGDALLIRGCGRTDFQGGCAKTLFRSVRDKLFSLSEDTLVYPAHDYRGRTVSSIREEKLYNPRLGGGRTESQFVGIMEQLNLAYPRKIDMALPLNMRMGAPEEGNEHIEARSVVQEADWPVLRTPTGAPNVVALWVAERPESVRLVDVRGEDEWRGSDGRLPDAELVPLDRLLEQSATWDKENAVVLYCRSGGRSDRGAVELERRGFKHVFSMRGGILRWRALGLPVDGGLQG